MPHMPSGCSQQFLQAVQPDQPHASDNNTQHLHCRPRRSQQLLIQCAAATDQQSGDMKTVVQKMTPGDVPFPWSEKDPFRLPVSIDRVQKMLITLGELQDLFAQFQTAHHSHT
jgi:hypothetical protein